MAFFLLIIFITFAFIFYKTDKYLYGTFVTPTNMLVFPFLSVCVIILLVGRSLGFVPLGSKAIAIWLLWTSIFWASGFLLNTYLLRRKISPQKYLELRNKDISKLCILIAYFFISIVSFGLFNALKAHGGLSGLSSEEFTQDFASSGLTAHSLNVLKFLVVYFIITYKKNQKKVALVIVVIFTFLFLYQVKTWIFIPIVTAIIYKLLARQLKIDFKKAFYYPIAAFSIFFLVYFISLGSKIPFSFVFNHFFSYLFAGTLGLSEHLEQNLPLNVDFYLLVKPIENLINVVFGSGATDNISDFWVSTNPSNNKNSNVKTLIGGILIYGGLIKGTIYIIVLGFLIHLLQILAVYSRSIFITILYCYYLASLFMGFFDIYFNHLFFWELPVICFALIIASKIKLNLSFRNESVTVK